MQLEKERPYLENEHHVHPRAFGLDQIQEQAFPADEAVTADNVREQPARRSATSASGTTVPCSTRSTRSRASAATTPSSTSTSTAISSRDGYRQVMVAVRELNQRGLPSQAQTWVNQRLKFTHGYGVTMALVAAVAEEGRPQLIIQDVPPRGDIPISRPGDLLRDAPARSTS